MRALIERLGAVGFIYTGVILAAQTFMALLPLLIALVALLPSSLSAEVAGTLRSRLGISGASDTAIGDLLANRQSLRGGVSAFGVVVVLASATSFTRALQRMYELSWGLTRFGLRASVRGVVWLLGLTAYLALLGLAIRLTGSGGGPATVLRTGLTVASAVVLWCWTPYVLLMGRVRLRALLPGGALTAVAMLVLGRVSEVVVPRTVRSNERQFGPIGVVFAIQSWLVIVACTIVAAAVLGAVVAQSGGTIGRIARGSADPDSWRRT